MEPRAMPIFASRAGVIVTLYRGPRENRTVTAKEAQLAGRPPPAYTRMTHCGIIVIFDFAACTGYGYGRMNKK
jgi:hypothetical protein